MKKILIVVVSFITVLYSCEKEYKVNHLIDGYYIGYMDYPEPVKPDPNTDNIVDLKYSGNHIIKRIGALFAISPTSGYNYKYSEDFYNELTYTGNMISIVNKSSLVDYVVSPNERKIYLDNSGRMIQEVFSYYSTVYTIDYLYNMEGLLTKSITLRNVYLDEYSLFYYNSKNNLDSIVTNNELDLYREVEIFSDYDNAPNPLKPLIIFRETFHRALSENNYRKYTMKKLNFRTELTEIYFKQWTLSYDNDGNCDFTKK